MVGEEAHPGPSHLPSNTRIHARPRAWSPGIPVFACVWFPSSQRSLATALLFFAPRPRVDSLGGGGGLAAPKNCRDKIFPHSFRHVSQF